MVGFVAVDPTNVADAVNVNIIGIVITGWISANLEELCRAASTQTLALLAGWDSWTFAHGGWHLAVAVSLVWQIGPSNSDLWYATEMTRKTQGWGNNRIGLTLTIVLSLIRLRCYGLGADNAQKLLKGKQTDAQSTEHVYSGHWRFVWWYRAPALAEQCVVRIMWVLPPHSYSTKRPTVCLASYQLNLIKCNLENVSICLSKASSLLLYL